LIGKFSRVHHFAVERANPTINVCTNKSQLTANSDRARELGRRRPMTIGPVLDGDAGKAELRCDLVNFQQLHGRILMQLH
jgi:hypothetical protein